MVGSLRLARGAAGRRFAAAGLLLATVACVGNASPPAERPRAHEGWGPEQFEGDRRCRQGDKPACSELGRFLIVNTVNRADVERGFQLLQPACDGGDLAACTALGERYGWYDDDARRRLARDLLTDACAKRWSAACTAYGRIVQGSNYQNLQEAARWFLTACELGDANGCSQYGWAGFNGGRHNLAVDGFGKACRLGRRADCHMLGKILFSEDASRAAAAQVWEDNCIHGFTTSCSGAAVALAPLLSPLGDCKRAAPLAAQTCKVRQAESCAVSDACKVAAADGERDAAVERLRAACERKVALACLYWADAQPASMGDGPQVRNAYETACRHNSDAGPIGCSRLAALQLASATAADAARRPIDLLTAACGHSVGEACCTLAGVYQAGKWVAADPARAEALRAKACALGQSRCCGRGGTRAAGPSRSSRHPT